MFKMIMYAVGGIIILVSNKFLWELIGIGVIVGMSLFNGFGGKYKRISK